MTETNPDTSTPASGKSIPKWGWVLGAALLLIVAWQVGRGVFVKSIDAPGGASINFYPPESASDQTAQLKAQQDEIQKATQQAIDQMQKAALANAAQPTVAGSSSGLMNAGPNSTNSIVQTNGTKNSAAINGDHNHIEQSGSGNSAVIGGN